MLKYAWLGREVGAQCVCIYRMCVSRSADSYRFVRVHSRITWILLNVNIARVVCACHSQIAPASTRARSLAVCIFIVVAKLLKNHLNA